MIYKAIQGLPQAHARIKGSKEYPDIRGNVYLYEVYNGTVLLGELMGIPEELEKKYGGFFGFHIHEGNACTGDSQDPFADTKGHYNPEKEEHPRHAGDLPPVLSNDGTAWMEIYTGRLVEECRKLQSSIFASGDIKKAKTSLPDGKESICRKKN